MAVKFGKYHLFQRRLEYGTFWYYWYYDETGKQVQKACGYGCESKRDAAAFLENLLQSDLLNEKRKDELKKTSSNSRKISFSKGLPTLSDGKPKAISSNHKP
ncbi:hypothetical protein [Treponema sp. R80B11-R83G3]